MFTLWALDSNSGGGLIQKAVEGQIKANDEGQSFGVRPTWS
jgi:hypothetical protein